MELFLNCIRKVAGTRVVSWCQIKIFALNQRFLPNIVDLHLPTRDGLLNLGDCHMLPDAIHRDWEDAGEDHESADCASPLRQLFRYRE